MTGPGTTIFPDRVTAAVNIYRERAHVCTFADTNHELTRRPRMANHVLVR
jgi:hypothetical protein